MAEYDEILKAVTALRREVARLRKVVAGKLHDAEKAAAEPEQLLRVSTVAGMLDLSPTMVRKLISRGDLSAVRDERKWLVPKSQVSDYIGKMKKKRAGLA